jgi:aminopeptidase N
MRDGQPQAIYLKDYQVPSHLISTVALRFELFPDRTIVHAILKITANPASEGFHEPSGVDLVLNGEQLQLQTVSIDGRALQQQEYTVDAESLRIVSPPQQFELSTSVQIDPAKNTALEGLYLSSGNYCTQCEAEGFRKITYFLDRPDVMAIFSVRIEGDLDSLPVLLSNGNRGEQGLLDNGRHFVEWHDPFPKPSYLFALVAGDLSCCEGSYHTSSGRNVSIEIYTEAHNADKCDHAIASLQKAMQWDEQTFGLEYDLDAYMIVAVDDFNMGAMENKGLNVFNSKCVLASPSTATDADYMTVEAVIAHEYFHNWTGNRVTCRDWFQLSLKEGLTVFRDQEFTSDVTSRAVKRIQDVRYFRAYQYAEDAGPMTHPIRPASYVEINNFYTLTVYEKGAEVVRMYQTLLGKDGFKKGLARYFEKHDGQAVTTDDFANAMAEANQYDLGNFLNWYSQSGTPTLKIMTDWNQASHEYSVEITQQIPTHAHQLDPKPYLIPVSIALFDEQGQACTLRLKGSSQVQDDVMMLKLSEEKQTFVFEDIKRLPVPSFLQNFSAPVKLDYDYSFEDSAFLMAHEQDPFNRWDAGQRFATEWMLNAVVDQLTGKPIADAEAYIQALRVNLNDTHLDAAFIAEMLVMPSESYLAEFMQPVEVDVVYQVRKHLIQQIAAGLETQLLALYHQHRVSDEYQYNAQHMGQRRLSAVCLSYLNSLDKPEYAELAKAQYQQADNMTDMMSALEAINDSELPLRTELLEDFGQRWKQDALVMDKWFSLQARSRRSQVLDTVTALLEHECFSIKNPNKVRSLIGGFTMGNPTAFHAKDGSGYAFLTHQVIQLDAINPQVASRLVKPLIDWKKYDVKRQLLMKESLREIKSNASLSRDVFELVDRSLATSSE